MPFCQSSPNWVPKVGIGGDIKSDADDTPDCHRHKIAQDDADSHGDGLSICAQPPVFQHDGFDQPANEERHPQVIHCVIVPHEISDRVQ